MKRHWKLPLALLAGLLAIAFVALFFANRIQRADGAIEISEGYLPSEVGNLFYKLAAYAIELCKRGVIVLSLDEYGHGASEPGLKERGYVNHMVKVNYGEDSVEDKTFRSVGGTVRYRLLMNFSNLSFFDERYVTDDAGNVLTDSSCGGIAAYKFLSELPNVDRTKLGISGHSMGT